MTHIQQAIKKIKNQIHEWEVRYQRNTSSVSVLAVSKKQPIEKIREAIHAGQLAFGENYLQESLEKISALSEKEIEWHFIGPVQSNKTKKIAEHFSWVHTVSDKKIAKRLNEQRPSHLPPLNICIQVNTSGEKTKSGIPQEDVLSLADYCLTLPHLKLRGLMTIPAKQTTGEEQRKAFRTLRNLFDDLNRQGFHLDTLSMGMSDDMEAAIAEGATLLRIGTAIFGERI